MKLLFDENLSHRLARKLADRFPDSCHVRDLDLAAASDLEVWDYARAHDFVIVTQDADYADWNKLRGSPPKIIWVRCGNSSTDEIERKLRNAAERIHQLESPYLDDVDVIEVW